MGYSYNTSTLRQVARLASKSVRDSSNLHSLLIEAGHCAPGPIVSCLVKERTLQVQELLKSDQNNYTAADFKRDIDELGLIEPDQDGAFVDGQGRYNVALNGKHV